MIYERFLCFCLISYLNRLIFSDAKVVLDRKKTTVENILNGFDAIRLADPEDDKPKSRRVSYPLLSRKSTLKGHKLGLM